MRFLGLLTAVLLLITPPALEAGVYITWHRKPNPGPSAREQAGRAARQQVDAAQANFTRAYAQAMRNHPLNEELRQARVDLTKARIDCDHTVRNTRAKLGGLPEVKAQQKLINRLERDLENTKDMALRVPIASDLMHARSKLTQLEYAALGDDVYVVIARATVLDATNKVRSLEEQYQTTLAADPGFASAKEQLDAARRRLTQPGG
jgi:predicted RNase H-like nuclease (RuvC/YqgF family)